MCGDCVYVLIDTSHSMKSKLDLVKDKIIRLIWVRWECHGLALGLLSHKHAFGSPCPEWLWTVGRATLHCRVPEKANPEMRPSAVLELSQCSLAIRPVL